MALCELCGEESFKLTPAKVAGTSMNVCNRCLSHGQVSTPSQKHHTFYHKKKEDEIQEIVPDFAQRITRALAQKGYDVHNLARGVNIKESTLKNYLSGKIKPDVSNALKIERFLGITLVEGALQTSTDNFTLKEEEKNLSSRSLGDLLEEQLKKKK